MYDYLTKGGTIVDGTGTAPITGDVAIADGKIAAIGGNIDGPAKETIDAAGLIVTPGWVDVRGVFCEEICENGPALGSHIDFVANGYEVGVGVQGFLFGRGGHGVLRWVHQNLATSDSDWQSSI